MVNIRRRLEKLEHDRSETDAGYGQQFYRVPPIMRLVLFVRLVLAVVDESKALTAAGKQVVNLAPWQDLRSWHCSVAFPMYRFGCALINTLRERRPEMLSTCCEVVDGLPKYGMYIADGQHDEVFARMRPLPDQLPDHTEVWRWLLAGDKYSTGMLRCEADLLSRQLPPPPPGVESKWKPLPWVQPVRD